MPFGPNLSSPSNRYNSGARAGFALARFPQVLPNVLELDAYFWVPGTLSQLQKHLVPAEML